MKKLHTYLTLFLLVFLACIPPINFFISIPPMDIWFVLILVTAFFGFYTLFLNVNPVVKLIAVGSFVLCFFSSAPPISFTSYVPIVLGCYLYINCTKIEDWKIIFRSFQILLILNLLLMLIQAFGQDSLLNFGLGKNFTCYGIIGHHMQMGSFSVILSAVLLPFSIMNLIFPFFVAFFCHSAWTLLSIGIGCYMFLQRFNKKIAMGFVMIGLLVMALYCIKEEKFQANITPENGRLVVWEKSLGFAMQKPLTGWGPGTYKIVFPAIGLTKLHDIPYLMAHNWIVELLFEVGIPFTLLLVGAFGGLIYRLYYAREFTCVVALTMITSDMMVHFPDRMLQSIGIIICFLAYCETRLNLRHRVIKKP